MVYEFGAGFRSKNEDALKHFATKTFLFILVAVAIFHLRAFYLLQNDRYQKKVFGSEIYVSINKSKQKHSTKKLLLGDSVGKQLFDNVQDNDSITSLACNQAISIAGHYLLLQNYLNAGNLPEMVYLFYSPLSFQNNLDQKFTYNYFVKPFYNSEYSSEIDATVDKSLEKIQYKWLANYAPVKTSNWSPEIDESSKHQEFLSPISKDYLIKMLDASKKYKFQLVIVPAPVSAANSKAVKDFWNDYTFDDKLAPLFRNYFKNVKIMNDDLFSDGTHFKEPEKFREMFAQSLHSQ